MPGLRHEHGLQLTQVANVSRALRMVDDVIYDTTRLRRKAQAEGVDPEIVQKLKRLESDLDDLLRQLKRVKSELG